MDWGDVGKKLAGIGLPLLGGVLPIPGGAVLGQALAGVLVGDERAGPDSVLSALADPAAVEKAREFYATHQATILQMTLQAETAQLQAVNETMRAEAGAANWPTYTWRPFLGFVAGVMLLGDFFVLPLAGIIPPMIPVEAWAFLSAVLGIASWGHSKALADPGNTAVTRG